MKDVGLNLFSLRTLLPDEKGFLEVALRLKEMGYTFLQFSGCPYDHEMIARVSKESGMPIVLTHVPMDRIINEPEKLMEEHALFGCKNIGLGAMDPKLIPNELQCKQTVEKLNRSGEIMKANGFKFFYHNHHFEFFKHGGQTVFEYMIENAPAINFTVDTYWLQYGGVSIMDFLPKLDGRMECVHLKDYRIETPLKADAPFSLNPRFAPVGEGTIDFVKVAAQMKELGAKYFIVEQDNACEFPDPYAQVQSSINYIRKEL